MELGVPDPVPALNAPAVPHQLQQGFWLGSQAGEEQVGRLKWLAITDAIGGHFHDPAGANPGLANVLRCLFRPRYPGDVATVAYLMIRCHKRDATLSLELALDLAMQCLLVALDGQEKVGPLLVRRQ